MKRKVFLVLICSLCSLTSCHGTSFKDKLGIRTTGPDEFSVMPAQPLTIPPDFNLPAPNDRAQSATGIATSNGYPSIKTSPHLSNSENILLNRADSNLRKVKKIIDEQNLHDQNNPTNPAWMDKLNFLFPKKTLGKDSSIHPSASIAGKTNDNKNSLPLGNNPSSHKRICNVKQGSVVYCDDVKIIKNFPVPLE